MTNIKWPALFILLVGIFVFLQYRLWFEPDGIKDMLKMKTALQQQDAEIMRLKKSNSDLLLQIQRLEKSEDANESRARNELGMIKKDETFYQVVK